MSVNLGVTHDDGPYEHRCTAFRRSFWVVSGIMHNTRRRHTQIEQLYCPDRLCQSLDAGSEPRAFKIAALEATGCTMIQTETSSASSLESRTELGIILDFIHPDETLVVTRIDRLVRSLRDL